MSKILITGATGFLGSIVFKNLVKSNHEITTIGIEETNDITCDLAKTVPVIISDFDWLIHIAGKAHVVPKDQDGAKEFFQINLEGTRNLIKGVEKLNRLPKSVVFISTVAVYGLEKGKMIKENHERKATDPYGLSKIYAENFLLEWGEKHGVKVGVIRPPLIIGRNAPGNLRTMIKAIKLGYYLNINRGTASRSMVLADDLAVFLPIISELGGIYHLTDGQHPSFGKISNLIANHIGKKKTLNLPFLIAKIIAKAGDFLQKLIKKDLPFNSRKFNKMTSSLTFDDSKARAIGWNPRSVTDNPKLWLE
jgi:GlcNAc-P-P-Und epimerase